MKITAIKPQIKRKNRVSLFVDDKFVAGIAENLILDFNLFPGKEITEKELKSLAESENLNKAMEKAYRLLAVRPRSTKEMADRLSEKFEKNIVQAALKKLFEFEYLDDLVFARQWVKERSIKKGKKALYFELLKKGIAKEQITEVLEVLDNEEMVSRAFDLVLKKQSYLILPGPEKKQKITAFLARRGYDYNIIREVLTKVSQ